jgi:hypothetical protein
MKGDKLGEGEDNSIQVLLPANIRFGFYPTREDVKVENKFAALPLKLPLITNMKDSYKQISRVTSKLKSSIGYVYTAYWITKFANIIGPRFLPRIFLHKASMKFTMAFSNTPGPIKGFFY